MIRPVTFRGPEEELMTREGHRRCPPTQQSWFYNQRAISPSMSLLLRSHQSPWAAVHWMLLLHRMFLELFWNFLQGHFTSLTRKSVMTGSRLFNSNHHFPARSLTLLTSQRGPGFGLLVTPHPPSKDAVRKRHPKTHEPGVNSSTYPMVLPKAELI